MKFSSSNSDCLSCAIGTAPTLGKPPYIDDRDSARTIAFGFHVASLLTAAGDLLYAEFSLGSLGLLHN